MKKLWIAVVLGMVLGAAGGLAAQDAKTAPVKSSEAPAEARAGREYSGMYSFLKDGEFLQVTVEDEGKVTGFVSRYGEGLSDKGAFLDQFFKSGKLDGNKLTFTTQTVHGVWFEFKGTVERGDGKKPGEEGYYVLKGALTENTADVDKKESAHSRDVVFKQFPEDASPAPQVRK